jgi:hypothetical protein
MERLKVWMVRGKEYKEDLRRKEDMTSSKMTPENRFWVRVWPRTRD